MMSYPNYFYHISFKAFVSIAAVFVLMAPLSVLRAAELIEHTVYSDGHPLVLWEKSVASPKGHIVLHHGRTWSSLPDFDLQVDGEDLSLMDGFNDAGYSVWALDARGYGGTSRDSSGWNTPDKAAKDLATVLEWLEARNQEKTHVWGWSYGSMVAQLTAQRYPENMLSVTLFGYPVNPDRQYNGDAAVSPPANPTTAQAAASDFIVPGAITQNAIDTYVRQAIKADPVRADWNELQQWNALAASAVGLPTLLLQAEFDPLASTESHAKVFSNFANPNKQWIVLAGGDHAALLEAPRAKLLKASVDFIEWLDK
ncbi:MAG: pimeloyl-ACP methyl ester carboxylesterase [Pseudohongiellaceae bacterium]|jgi:pimeloyl-ACP methyl ester carboxylesterase